MVCAVLPQDNTKTFMPNYSLQHPYHVVGSGFGMLSLAWPSASFTVAPDGERDYIAGSALQTLQRRGVKFMYASLLTDWDALTPAAPAADPALCGPALYSFDLQGAGMAFQVHVSKTDMQARAHNNLVMAKAPGDFFSACVSLSDLQTPPTRALVMAQHKTGSVVSCTSRYFFRLQYLAEVMKGPNSFHVKVVAKAPCAHIELDMCDLTNGPKGRAVAVASKTKGPNPATTVGVWEQGCG